MLLEKVWRFVLKHDLFQEGDRILVAVSGGPDSLCLLHILRVLAPRLNLELVVAHLDHRIRPEARQEADAVRKLAKSWSLPFEEESVDVLNYQAREKLSPEEAARVLRYRFLQKAAQKHGATKIAAGHQQNDQAETVLLNFLRGAGPDSLAGMPARRPLGRVHLVRPLLEVTRSEIEEYCRQHDLHPARDSSNLKTDYTRNRIRLELIPYLEAKYNPRIREALLRLACIAAADRRFLEREARKYNKIITRRQGRRLLVDRPAFSKLPKALQGRVARLALERFIPRKKVGWQQVNLLLKVAAGSGPVREQSLPGGVAVSAGGRHLVIAARPRLEILVNEPRPLQVPGITSLEDGRLIMARIEVPERLNWPPEPGQAFLDYDLLSKTLVVRHRWPGARFYPQGAPGGKKLKEFMIDRKIPRHRRDSHPLVVAGDEVVWVAGLRIAQPYRVTGQTKKVLVLELKQ